MLEDFAALARELDYGEPRIPIVSNLNGELLVAERATDPGYWVSQAREPVRFAAGVATLRELGVSTYLELGPAAVLSSMAASCLTGAGDDVATIPAIRTDRDEVESLVESLAAAHVAGAELDRAALYPRAKHVPLPTYPFRRKRYWLEPPGRGRDVAAAGLEDPDHPLLGAATRLAGGELVLSGRISLATHPWLADHVVGDEVLFPGAAFLELALAAGARAGVGQVEELVLSAPLRIPGRGGVQLQVSVAAPGEDGARAIAIHSRPEPLAGEPPGEWDRHAEGALSAVPGPAPEMPDAWPPAGAEPIPVEDAYERLAALGYRYGPAFQGLTAAWRAGEEVFAEVRLAPDQAPAASRFGLHPALLDAGFHVALLDAEPRLPFSFAGARLGEARGAARLRVRIAPAGQGWSVDATDPAGRHACSIAAIASRPLDAARLHAGAAPAGGELLTIGWTEVELPRQGREGGGEVEVFEVERGGTGESPAAAARARCAALLERLQGFLADRSRSGDRLAIVTTGALAVEEGEAPDLSGAAAQGLVRSAQSEHPGRFLLVDTDGSEASGSALAAAVAAAEPQLALRRGRAFSPRQDSIAGAVDRLLPPPRPWRLDAPKRGSLAGLELRADTRAGAPLGPTQVRLEMRAAGLNFRDVLVVLDRYPGRAPLGGEGAGVVLEVGSDVADLKPGDRAMGLVDEAFATRAIADRALLAPVPPGWSWRQAAATPIAFLTAYFGLLDLANLQRGERVLIHAGAGGVGMAAIQLARHLGAEVFATAGPGKWEALQELGLDRDRLASSRDLDFACEFSDQGFDLVLNSLAGEFVDASLALLAPGGRFLELGKADVRDPERVAADRDGARYRAFDLRDAGPERLGEMLAEVLALFERGALRHPPIAAWDLARAPAAFRRLREGRNVGKLVFDVPPPFDPAATVLIAGGTGALGALLARHLVERHGVRHLLLAGRDGPAAEGAAELRDELERLGARVDLVACDLRRREQVADLLGAIPAEHPLGAVVHAVGVLADATIEGMDDACFARAFDPKATAAWHLHELTADLGLSHFVTFSSAAGVLGGAGQGNYAAANAFLDALALRRRAEGLPATSIAWGPWRRPSRMTAHLGEADRARMRRLGLAPLADEHALALFDAALDAGAAQVLALRRPGSIPTRRPRAAPRADELVALDPARRERALLDLVRGEAAAVLGHDSKAAVEPRMPFKDLGLDSLAAVELRNRLADATGLVLDAGAAFHHPTADELATHLAAELAGVRLPHSNGGGIEVPL